MARVHDERLRYWAEGAALAGILVVPLAFVPAAHDAFGLPKLLTVTAATVVGWAAWLARGRPAWPTSVPSSGRPPPTWAPSSWPRSPA